MTNSKSDKPLVRNMIIFCMLAILIFHFAWFNQLMINYHNALFAVVDGILFGFFVGIGVNAYNKSDDPNKEWLRYIVVALAVTLCVWAGGWAAGVNEKVL